MTSHHITIHLYNAYAQKSTGPRPLLYSVPQESGESKYVQMCFIYGQCIVIPDILIHVCFVARVLYFFPSGTVAYYHHDSRGSFHTCMETTSAVTILHAEHVDLLV